MMFSFLVPLVLMNMLIAIMSETYSRVTSNNIAADMRSIAELLYEIYELKYDKLKKINPDNVEDKFYYFFTSQALEEDDDDNEGMVGDIKDAII